jgi:hypothetical protein
MAEYPTKQSVQESLSFDELEALVEALPAYERTAPIANLYGDGTSPAILRAWAALVEALQEFYTEGKLQIAATAITRELSGQEMNDRAIAREQSRIYTQRQKEEDAAK